MMDASQVSQDIFLRILVVSAQASVLAVLIVALQRVLRGWLSPAWRHALWGLLVARLLLLWSVPSSWSLYTALHHLWMSARSTVLVPVARASAPGESFTPALSAAAPAFSGMQWVVCIWLCGAFFTLALALIQAGRLGLRARLRAQVTDPATLAVLDHCRQRMGIRRCVPMLSGPDTGSPALLGCIRPRLLVPERLLAPGTRDQLRCVLLHELAHIRRQDVLTGWLAYLLLSLHWFNPVLWWARRRCIDDRELACDARVLSVLTPKERHAYGHALLDQFRAASATFSHPGLVGVLEGTSSIERRIEMITAFGRPTRRGSIPALAVILLLTVTALTGEEETVWSNSSAQSIVPAMAGKEAPVLLAQETSPDQSFPLPAESAVPSATRPEAAAPAGEPVAVPMAAPESSCGADIPVCRPAAAAATVAKEQQPDAQPHVPAATAPAKADKTGTKANGADLRQKSTPRPEFRNADVSPALMSATTPRNAMADQGRRDARVAEATTPTPAVPVPAEKPAGKNPPTLHSAVNKVAKDYAESLEVKSTRPGEDLPFTLTVGGEIRIRGEYRSGMPKRGGLPRNGFATSMNTRVGVCADFGQVQCVAEVSKTEGSPRIFGQRDAD